jgi:hypothetical protein
VNKSLRAQVALAELEAMGLTVDDLVVAAGRDRSAPPPERTVAEYLPVVAAGYKPRTRRTYNSYWIQPSRAEEDRHPRRGPVPYVRLTEPRPEHMFAAWRDPQT